MTREQIRNAMEIFDFDSRAEVHDRTEIESMLDDETNVINVLPWERLNDDDQKLWPASGREGRKIVTITPTNEQGILQPLSEATFVVG